MSKRKLSIDEIGKAKKNPLLKDLKVDLKDPSCYAPIETQLRNALYSDHKHASVKGMVKCKRCVAKMQKRQDLLKGLGFKSYPQYLEWKRIMSIIISQQDIHFS